MHKIATHHSAMPLWSSYHPYSWPQKYHSLLVNSMNITFYCTGCDDINKTCELPVLYPLLHYGVFSKPFQLGNFSLLSLCLYTCSTLWCVAIPLGSKAIKTKHNTYPVRFNAVPLVDSGFFSWIDCTSLAPPVHMHVQ